MFFYFASFCLARHHIFINLLETVHQSCGKNAKVQSRKRNGIILVSSVDTVSDSSSAAAVVVEPERALKPQFDDAVLQVFLLNTFVVPKTS
jgi:hypothetical protein